ncbi:hypothetical protein [Kitasatospora acidiphila]|uniref:hypothetical protein n=1 Tax=Kitasatospora acidiphila TaxID=2567942 RepID=UPI003C773A9E
MHGEAVAGVDTAALADAIASAAQEREHADLALSAAAPDITRWFNPDVWTKALENTGYTVTRR